MDCLDFFDVRVELLYKIDTFSDGESNTWMKDNRMNRFLNIYTQDYELDDEVVVQLSICRQRSDC
jgi:hypothetical protein